MDLARLGNIFIRWPWKIQNSFTTGAYFTKIKRYDNHSWFVLHFRWKGPLMPKHFYIVLLEYLSMPYKFFFTKIDIKKSILKQLQFQIQFC